ncbi:hypothetical protein PHET_07321 [Paragonimus heterotremus]|uniref:Uncharacterized protein n=1 Tax=Paragonimus heterotremus TaxID=100268 RepID=A0A8J4WEG9_9TREM|nr:hypothetical protein PHET_07321 [Paragonimus heterotremus]
MNTWTIILCFMFKVKGNRTLFNSDRVLCIVNAIRQEYFNCVPPKDVLPTRLKWNPTLEYYSNVYTRQRCVEDLNIPEEIDFKENKELTSTDTTVYVYEE